VVFSVGGHVHLAEKEMAYDRSTSELSAPQKYITPVQSTYDTPTITTGDWLNIVKRSTPTDSWSFCKFLGMPKVNFYHWTNIIQQLLQAAESCVVVVCSRQFFRFLHKHFKPSCSEITSVTGINSVCSCTNVSLTKLLGIWPTTAVLRCFLPVPMFS